MSFPAPSTFVPPPPYDQSHPYQPIPPYTQQHEWSTLAVEQAPDEPYADPADPPPPTHSPSLAPDSLAQPLSTMRLAPRKGKAKPKRKTTAKKRGKAIRTPALATARPSRRRAESPNEPCVPIPVKNARGPLLAAPPGSRLEVNDLLILHPPKLSPDTDVDPINQYSSSNAASGGVAGIGEGYMSRFEMYTCRLCSKTYDGKNARSVARRHLQDKHGVPLALQKRRSRWDFEPERPKTAEMKAKTLQSKRQWAAKNRQHNRLERTFAVYLAQFGPAGLITPCGLRLVAPEMRGAPTPMGQEPFPDGQLDWGQIPADLIEGIKTLRAIEQAPEGAKLEVFDEGDEAKVEGEQGEAGPSRRFPSPSRTPISDARSFQHEGEADQADPRWNHQWYASATHVDDHALQAAIAQHLASTGESSQVVQHDGPSQAGPYAYVPQAANDQWYCTEQRLQCMDRESDLSDLEEDEKVDAEPPAGTMMHWQGVPNYGYWYPNGSEMPFVPFTLSQAALQHVGQFQPYVVTGQYGQHGQPNQLPLENEVTSYEQGQLAIIEEENSTSTARVQTLQEAMELDGDEAQMPVEAAAETLLEIHSTPARPDTHIPSSILRHLSDDTPARPSPLKQSTSDPLTLTQSLFSSAFKRAKFDSKLSFPLASENPVPKGKLLDAHEIKEASRPRPIRAMSLIARAAAGDDNSRPDGMTRSLSFSAGLDDPFALSPVKVSKKRRSTIASPSPLIKRKKDDFTRHHSQQIYRDPETSNGMTFPDPVKNGIKDSSAGPSLAPSLAPDIPSSPARLPLQILRNRTEVFATPSRALKSPHKSPSRPDPAPASAFRGWQFSSPGNGETAASLGLVPQWFGLAGGFGTPGLKGLVSAETPVEKSVKRRVIRKSAMGEQENMDESE